MPSDIIVQNDADGSLPYLATASGEYKFIHCEDTRSKGGTGKVTRSGPMLEVKASEYWILASVNLDSKSGKAVINVFAPIGDASDERDHLG